MKKLVLALMLSIASYSGLYAQEVYKEIMKLSKKWLTINQKTFKHEKLPRLKWMP